MNKQLPTGTVTFLFTDIEGSTPLWEQMPQAMQASVAQHHAILQKEIENNKGGVFQIVGDAFQAAFRLASDGLAAAIAAQSSIQLADWGATGPLKVRMGLHTGTAELDTTPGPGGQYEYTVGHTLNRAARVMSAGHGGQILLSQETADLVARELPAGVWLKDLGEHRLKGMQFSEHLFQVMAPDLPQQFPPLATSAPLKNNLPVQLSKFIGRENEIAQVKGKLSEHRLVTLTGSGGVGKTRLAIQVGREVLPLFQHGVWLIELASLADPELVLQTVMTTFGLSEDARRTPLAVVADYLREKTALLVLDNCEHVIDACAELVEHLLVHCPNLRVLASSREALGIEGEVAIRVPSLSLPPGDRLTIEVLTQSDAAQLFIDRAAIAMAGWALTEDNAPAVAQICRRLDGIALAIELAASRVKLLKIEQIAERLDDAFRFLTGGSRTALPRHQTLRATIDWSYNLLSNSERKLFCRLSVFSGGWTLEAAEIVCSGDGIEPFEVLDLLSQLVNKSLVIINERGDEPRFHLLETIRQYGGERLTEWGEREPVHDRHLNYFLKLAEEDEPNLHSASQLVWLKRLEREHNNFRAALEWSQSGGRSEAGLRLAAALWWFWNLLSFSSEGYDWLELALEHGQRESASLALRARALYRAGHLAHYLGGLNERTKALCQESLELNKELGDKQGCAYSLVFLAWIVNDTYEAESLYFEALAWARQTEDAWLIPAILMNMGDMMVDRGDYPQAVIWLDECISEFRKIGDIWGIAWSLLVLYRAYNLLGEDDQTVGLLEESLTFFRELGYKVGVRNVLVEQAKRALRQSNYALASQLFEESLILMREMGIKHNIAVGILYLSSAVYYQGDYRRATALLTESLSLYRQIDEMQQIPMVLLGLAQVSAAIGQAERATRLLGTAEAHGDALGRALNPIELTERTRIVDSIRAQLDEPTYANAIAEGRAMTMDHAIEYAFSLADDLDKSIQQQSSSLGAEAAGPQSGVP